jgi:hypothetical protein
MTQPDPGHGTQSQTQTRRSDFGASRIAIFVYDVIVLGVLLAIGIALAKSPTAREMLSGYRFPVLSMWFGALGGLMISFKGVFDHAKGQEAWDDSFGLWHIGRPLSGAIAGLMTVIILQAVNPGSSLTHPVVYVAAFIFGTQERRFFNFLYEVAKLVVQVPDEVKLGGFRITEVVPTEGPAGTVVVVRGQGLESGCTIKLGPAPLEKMVFASDATSAAGIVPVRPLGADTVDVIAIKGSASTVLAGKFKYTA